MTTPRTARGRVRLPDASVTRARLLTRIVDTAAGAYATVPVSIEGNTLNEAQRTQLRQCVRGFRHAASLIEDLLDAYT